MESIANKKKIAKNTVMLYFRQILILLVSLYSVRVVLNTLGAMDYGIYNVVAGVVTMFTFLSTSMAAASQRFFSFSLGQNDIEGLKKIFCITLEIYLILIAIVVLFAETIGLWFVNNKLVIPAERMNAARWVYHFAIIAFIINLFSAPFMALIISHEDMSIYAYVSIIEALLKLAVVFLLGVFRIDKLILYGLLLCAVTSAVTLLYYLHCKIKYKESSFRFVWDKKLFSEIASFSGWCLFGSTAGIFKNQITNILLNIYFGPVVNAARSIALNVSNAVTSFASNFNMAVRPQIIKSYSAGDKKDTFALVYQSTKLSYFLLWVFMCPLFLEMNYVLTLWLKNVPDMTVIFTRLILIEVLFDSISYPMQSLSQASGKMKLYQSIVGGVLLLNLPFSYFVLKLGGNAYAVQFVAIAIAVIALALRIAINRILTGLACLDFINKSILPCVFVSAFSCALPFFIYKTMAEGFVRLAFVVISSTVSLIVFALLLGLSKAEKNYAFNLISNKLRKKQI